MGGRGSSSIRTTEETRRERAEGVLKAMRDAGMKPVKSVEETMDIIKKYESKATDGLSDYVNYSQYANYEEQFMRNANQYTKKGYAKGKNEVLKEINKNPGSIKSFAETKVKEYQTKLDRIDKSMKKQGITEAEYQKKYKQQHELFGRLNAIRNVNNTAK